MRNNLQLVKSDTFGTVECDFWQDKDKNILMTREQIGRALEYKNPQKAIDNLHQRYKDRLDRFSVTLKLRGTDGKKYDTCVYSAKGVYEICRWSRQPKADVFMDWVWDVIDNIRIHGVCLAEAKAEFPEFTQAIMLTHDEPKHYHFSNEIDMINRIVLGMSAKQFKEAYNLGKVNSIRPYMTPDQIEAVKKLQRIDIGLVVAVPDFQERKRILTEHHQRVLSLKAV